MAVESRRNVLKYILAFGSVHGLNILIGLVRNKLVSQILGPGGMGLVSMYNSGLQLVQNATNLGIAQSGVRTLSQAGDGAELSRLISVVRMMTLATALLGTIVYALFADMLMGSIMLSPIVGLAIVTAGEVAVLKALKKLRKVAQLSVLNVLAALVISVPIYYVYGEDGIIASLLLLALAQMIITIGYSFTEYRPSLRMSVIKRAIESKEEIRNIIVLGIAFVIAGILGSGAEFAIRAYLNIHGGTDVVGLYNAGYMMAFTYAGMAFAAFDSEYFPRLSTLCANEDNKAEIRSTIMRQIKMSLIIVAVMVTVLIPLLPWIIPLLFSDKFVDAIPMAQITMLAMVARAVMLPVEYLPLAKGDSRTYLILEAVYDILLTVGVCAGYSMYGLAGTGIAIVVACFISMITDLIYVKLKYRIW